MFEIFFKFSKRHCAVPLQPIWTTMVAAKLDHSRVLVTKFHKNRSMLKGRSAGQRHTDRQTRLKIRALRVCNRTNYYRQEDSGTFLSGQLPGFCVTLYMLLAAQNNH